MCGSTPAGQVDGVAAEVEFGQGDKRVDGFEAVGDAGQEPDFGVGGLDEAVGQSVGQGVDDVAAEVGADLAGQFGERGELAAGGPAQPGDYEYFVKLRRVGA